MFADAHAVPDGATVDADVCIVGAGVAGITVARELESPARRIVLLEAGFDDPEPITQSLYDGELHGLPYFPLGDATTRARQFGGTSNQWTGECRPLAPVDFETREWMPDSGWPFDLEHLRGCYERAQAACDLGRRGYAGRDWATPQHDDRLLDGGPIDTTVIQYSPPTRFGPASRDAFARARTTTVYLGANVVDLVAAPSGRALERVEVATIAGNRFGVRAQTFVLATGGIENARLLLAANGVHRRGIGNAHDLVGRYFMEHLYLDHAAVIAGDRRFRATYGADQRLDGQRVRFALALSDAVQASERLSGVAFVLGGRPPATGRADRAHGAARREGAARRVGSALGLRGAVSVKHIQEQVPDRESRVRLADDRDRLGVRRPVLDWRVSASDKRTAARSHAILAGALRGAGVGRLSRSRFDDGPGWPDGLRGARHHMGTTRMHPDATRGVVDADCRVHGVVNLYVAGSSVFPTSGTANPTLTIVALALRLADHLRSTQGVP